VRCFTAARSNGPGAPEVEELIAAFEAAGVTAEAQTRGEAMIARAHGVLAATGEGEGRRLLAGFTAQLFIT
jgi:hypothetical protein